MTNPKESLVIHTCGYVSQFLQVACPVSVATQVYKRTVRLQNAGSQEHEHGHEHAHRASQSLLSRVSAGGLLAVVPDPVTCFKDSSFTQVGGVHRISNRPAVRAVGYPSFSFENS